MAIITAQAKLYTGIRCWCVDKNISAALSASFSLGNKDIDFPTDVPVLDANGRDTIYPNVYIWRLRRAVADLRCPRPQPVLTDERYKTYGGGNNVIVPGFGMSGFTPAPASSYTLSPSNRVFEEIAGIASPSNANYSNPFYRAPSWKITYTTTGSTTYELKSRGQYISVGDTFTINSTINALIPISTTITVTSVIAVPVVESGGWTSTASVSLTFPTYIEIDIEKLGIPEGTDCVLNFEEGWLLEDRGRKLPSGDWEYPNAVQGSLSPEALNYVTFRTPYYGLSFINSANISLTRPLRIKQLSSTISSAMTATMKITYNPANSITIATNSASMVINPVKKAVGVSNQLAVFTMPNTFRFRARLFEGSITSQASLVNTSENARVRFSQSNILSQSTLSSSPNRFVGYFANIQSEFTVAPGPVIKASANITSAMNFSLQAPGERVRYRQSAMSSQSSLSAIGNFNKGNLSANMSAVAFSEVDTDTHLIYDSRLYYNFQGNNTWKNQLWFYINGIISPVTVFWGDGTSSVISSGGAVGHTYSVEGQYEVRIRGRFTDWGYRGTQPTDNSTVWFNWYFSNNQILGITKFGEHGVTSFRKAFENAFNMIRLPLTFPNEINDLSYAFDGCIRLGSNIVTQYGITANSNISAWPVNITVSDGAVGMFYRSAINCSISSWTFPGITSLQNTFRSEKFNQSLSHINTSNVVSLAGCFGSAFNHPSISSWDVSNVVDMTGIFQDAYSFNQNINAWNTASLQLLGPMSSTNSGGAFQGATAFNQPLTNWNVSNVTSFQNCFRNASAFNQPLASWDTGSVTPAYRMSAMFWNASSFDQDISNWCVIGVATKPNFFDDGTPATWTTAEKPVWGTCP